MKYFFLIIFFLPFALQAQETTISGVVSEAGTNVTLPGVSVYIKSSGVGVTTDFDGRYQIKAKKGDVIVFSFIGIAAFKIISKIKLVG